MNKISGTIPPEIGLLTALKQLRVPPASPTPGAARDRASASQAALRQPDRRYLPEQSLRRRVLPRQVLLPNLLSQRWQSRPRHAVRHDELLRSREWREDVHDLWRVLRYRNDDAHASSPRVSDARRAARTRLGVVGDSTTRLSTASTARSTARSRPRSASSRCWSCCEFPPRPRRPARRANAPRRRRDLSSNKVTGPIPTEIGKLTALTALRVPQGPPKPGAARDRASASQGPQQELRDHRLDPDRDRPAHGADVAASSPRAPDARRAARAPLGVAGTSASIISPVRSRPRSASSRR